MDLTPMVDNLRQSGQLLLDTNYFVRVFKRSEGLTSGAYRLICRK